MTTNKQSLSLLGIFSLLMVFLQSCNLDLGERGNGNMITQHVETGDFREIKLQGNFEVLLRQSDEPSLNITTDENLMDYIKAETKGGVLEIRSTKKLRPSNNSKVTVNYRTIEGIEIQGAASVHTDNKLSGDFLRVSMSGAGNVEMDVDLGKLELDISGAGAVELSGTADEQDISMSGAGGYDAGDLISRICRISISGVGGAEVFVTDDLEANVSGIGGVSYSGNPENVKSDISGLGSVSEENGEDPM